MLHLLPLNIYLISYIPGIPLLLTSRHSPPAFCTVTWTSFTNRLIASLVSSSIKGYCVFEVIVMIIMKEDFFAVGIQCLVYNTNPYSQFTPILQPFNPTLTANLTQSYSQFNPILTANLTQPSHPIPYLLRLICAMAPFKEVSNWRRLYLNANHPLNQSLISIIHTAETYNVLNTY